MWSSFEALLNSRDSDGLHSLCRSGGRTYTRGYSYEEALGLSDGDDVIGPQGKELEAQGASLKIEPKGTYIIEPEFPLALAVYGSHDWQQLIFGGNTGTVSVRGPLSYFGPCIHSCSPSVKQIARLKDEAFVFNLKKETRAPQHGTGVASGASSVEFAQASHLTARKAKKSDFWRKAKERLARNSYHEKQNE